MKFDLFSLVAAVTILVASDYVCCDVGVATSISGMETLLDTEKTILMILGRYIRANEAKIAVLKR